MTANTLITNARPWAGEAADVRITAGVITEIAPRGVTATPHESVVDGRGRILLPTFSDVHVHLDSTRIGLPFRPHTGDSGVWAMMLNDRRNWRSADKSIADRAIGTLGAMVAHGTTSVRSYAQVDVDARLERLDAVFAAREAHRRHATVEVIAFPQAGLLREQGSVDLLEEALRQGADVVGGIDPCMLDRDPAEHLNLVFGLAEKFGVPIDIHLHEPDQLARFSAELIIERTRALDLVGQVTISHGYGLGELPRDQLVVLLEQFAELDIAWATVAPPKPLPTLLLAEYGIRLGLGEDGQRDYWSPYGNADMLDRTWQLAFTNGFRRDEDIEHCLAVATVGGRSVLGTAPRLQGRLDRPGVSIGDFADLQLIAGETVTSAVMDRPADRTVLFRGDVVADHTELVAAT